MTATERCADAVGAYRTARATYADHPNLATAARARSAAAHWFAAASNARMHEMPGWAVEWNEASAACRQAQLALHNESLRYS